MPIKRREIRVATVSHRPTHGVDGPDGTGKLMVGATLQIERAARMGADLIAFPECYPQLALGDIAHFAEPTEGGTIDRIRELAKSHSLNMV